MRSVVKLPRLGETADSVLVVSWEVAVGDSVQVGDPLMTVDTDKVSTDVPAPVAGTVTELFVEVDDEIETGARLCAIETG